MSLAKKIGVLSAVAAGLVLAAAPASVSARPNHWHQKRTCKMQWRHGHRVRTCHWVRH